MRLILSASQILEAIGPTNSYHGKLFIRIIAIIEVPSLMAFSGVFRYVCVVTCRSRNLQKELKRPLKAIALSGCELFVLIAFGLQPLYIHN